MTPASPQPLPSTEQIPNSIDSVKNISPPIEAVQTSTALDGTSKNRNYLFWILGILILVVIFVTSFFVLTGKSRLVPSGYLAQPSDSEEQMAAVADDNGTAQSQCQPITQYQTLNIEPNNPETASWKSFIDENGLSFKYPNDMQIIDYGSGDKRISVMTQKEFDDICRDGCEPPAGLRTKSDKVEPYQDIEEYLKQTYDLFPCKKGGIKIDNMIIGKLNQYKIGSQTEVVFVEFSGCGGDACNYLFIKNMQTNKTVRIISIPELQDFEDFISTISLK